MIRVVFQLFYETFSIIFCFNKYIHETLYIFLKLKWRYIKIQFSFQIYNDMCVFHRIIKDYDKWA